MPGQILPPFLQEQLKLTDDQKKQLDALQKDLDAKLDKLLTDDQKKMLKEMRERGPGRPGGDKAATAPNAHPSRRAKRSRYSYFRRSNRAMRMPPQKTPGVCGSGTRGVDIMPMSVSSGCSAYMSRNPVSTPT